MGSICERATWRRGKRLGCTYMLKRYIEEGHKVEEHLLNRHILRRAQDGAYVEEAHIH